MANMTMQESFEELDAAFRDLGRELARAVPVVQLTALLIIADAWLARHHKLMRVMGWLDQLPAWTRFGTPEFFRAVILLHVAFVAAVVLKLLLA